MVHLDVALPYTGAKREAPTSSKLFEVLVTTANTYKFQA